MKFFRKLSKNHRMNNCVFRTHLVFSSIKQVSLLTQNLKNMDSIISLLGKGFGIMAIDTISFKSVFVTKNDLDKYIKIGKNKFLAVSGYPGDIIQFADFVQKTVQLYSIKTGLSLSTHSIANCIRKELSECLRKSPLKINLILIGFDNSLGPSLYYLDYLGTLQRLNYCAQGYSSPMAFSILDRYFKPNMSIYEAIEVLNKCIDSLKSRSIVKQDKFLIKIVDAEGCRCIGLL